ncbi:MAG: TVP38/TMEM64 family protein [Desulfobulbaceae bacterium]|nr:MAG: TVP38/TMEM64 family protein [Desulfobulbaceae bacterium]
MADDQHRKIIQKILIGCFITFGIIVFWYFDLGQYFTLEYVKASQDKFQALYLENRFPVVIAYMGIYIAVTALSLPGAAVLTLAGGALFGLGVGTVAVSFASIIGATLACLVSRFLLREWVQSKFSDRLVPINNGIEKDGAFYLFSLRLVPLFPFFVINLAMGLTRMRLFTLKGNPLACRSWGLKPGIS